MTVGRAVVPSCRRAVVPSCRRAVVPSCRRAVVPSCRRAVVPSCRRAVVPSCRRAVVPSCRSCRSCLWYFLSQLDGASVREAHCAQASQHTIECRQRKCDHGPCARSVIKTEERREGDLVVEWGSAGKYTEEEIAEEEVGYAEGWRE